MTPAIVSLILRADYRNPILSSKTALERYMLLSDYGKIGTVKGVSCASDGDTILLSVHLLCRDGQEDGDVIEAVKSNVESMFNVSDQVRPTIIAGVIRKD